MKKEVTVLLIDNSSHKAELVDISPDYPTIRAIIGSDVKEVHLDDETVILCADASLPHNMPEIFQRNYWGRCNIVIGKDPNNGHYRSLTAKAINKYRSDIDNYCL